MNRPALIISILLTALAVAIVGGVAYSARSIQNVQAAQSASLAVETTDQASNTDSPAAINPQLQQTLLDREAAYQKTIAEANARLAKDQQTLQALQAQVAALQNPPAQNASAFASAPASGVSPQKAAQIAGEYLKQSKIYSVEIAAFNGANVFKVTFSSGDIVMVSLNGEVLTVQRAARNNSGGEVASHFEKEEHEHEGHDD
jgi:hypothetical protein